MSSENKSQLNTTNNSSSKSPYSNMTPVSRTFEKKDDSQYSNRGYSNKQLGNKKANEIE